MTVRLLIGLTFLTLCEGCSGCLPLRAPKTARVAKLLADEAWYGTWRCANHDWNVIGYSDALKGEACDASVPAVTQLVQDPLIIAAVMGPKGDVGVVSTDWRVGYAVNPDAGITWLYQMNDCTYLEETRGLRCFEELR